MANKSEKPVQLLAEAAANVIDAPGLRAWNYGWCLAEYRNSAAAALEGPGGPVTIEPAARASFEEAVTILSREAAIRERWDLQELWGVVGECVVLASAAKDRPSQLKAHVDQLRTTKTDLILVTLANLVAPAEPLLVADCVIGAAGEALAESINTGARDRPRTSVETLDAITNRHPLGDDPVVVAATWTKAQGHLAVERAEALVSSVLDVALLLEPDPGRLGMYSMRGSTNRPGTRGVRIHRPALESAMKQLGTTAELAGDVRIVSYDAQRSQLGWHSADPVPIGELLTDPGRRELVERCVQRSSSVARRIRLASRWYAQAHWADDRTDAMLALGVALDALIGSASGLPGRSLRERFALLEPDPATRQERARRHAKIYGVRSAIAHGASSSALDETDFVRSVSRDVVWAAHRMLALDELFAPQSEDQLSDVFEQLRWGTTQWPLAGS